MDLSEINFEQVINRINEISEIKDSKIEKNKQIDNSLDFFEWDFKILSDEYIFKQSKLQFKQNDNYLEIISKFGNENITDLYANVLYNCVNFDFLLSCLKNQNIEFRNNLNIGFSKCGSEYIKDGFKVENGKIYEIDIENIEMFICSIIFNKKINRLIFNFRFEIPRSKFKIEKQQIIKDNKYCLKSTNKIKFQIFEDYSNSFKKHKNENPDKTLSNKSVNILDNILKKYTIQDIILALSCLKENGIDVATTQVKILKEYSSNEIELALKFYILRSNK